jgi:PadR family transcriptional regulator PadR
LLRELLRSPQRWRYGYDLMKETELASGTLYPILARLDEFGWLESEWEEPAQPGRPPRRRYRFTSDGRAQAREMVLRAAELQRIIGRP